MEFAAMEWNWAYWRRRLRKELGLDRVSSISSAEPREIGDWEASLLEQGVAAEWASPLARRLSSLHREIGRGSAASLVRAAAATVEVQSEARAYVERNMRDVKEVERLLGAFSGELEKLDEVLEVLAAYAQRMRSKPARKTGHTLH